MAKPKDKGPWSCKDCGMILPFNPEKYLPNTHAVECPKRIFPGPTEKQAMEIVDLKRQISARIAERDQARAVVRLLIDALHKSWRDD